MGDPLRVVITGASSGIGAATAVAFGRRGARLVLAARGHAGLEDTAAKVRTAGGATIASASASRSTSTGGIADDSAGAATGSASGAADTGAAPMSFQPRSSSVAAAELPLAA